MELESCPRGETGAEGEFSERKVDFFISRNGR